MIISQRLAASQRSDRWATSEPPPSDAPWRVIARQDNDYPEALESLPAPPDYLHVEGPLDRAGHPLALAVIGTRHPTPLAAAVTATVAYAAAEMGYPIISGMADGVDSIAHEAAVLADGPTIAVFGTGMDHTFPTGNSELRQRIVQSGGTLISQFASDQRPSKTTFPARNALVAALASSVYVVEMSERSGTRITVDMAVSLGRPVFFSEETMGHLGWARQLAEATDAIQWAG